MNPELSCGPLGKDRCRAARCPEVPPKMRAENSKGPCEDRNSRPSTHEHAPARITARPRKHTAGAAHFRAHLYQGIKIRCVAVPVYPPPIQSPRARTRPGNPIKRQFPSCIQSPCSGYLPRCGALEWGTLKSDRRPDAPRAPAPPSWDARPSAGASCKGQSLQGSRGRGREVRLLPRRARAREGCRPTRLHGATEWSHATAPARARMPRSALQDVLTRYEPG